MLSPFAAPRPVPSSASVAPSLRQLAEAFEATRPQLRLQLARQFPRACEGQIDDAVQGAGLPQRELGQKYTNTDYTFVDDTDVFDIWRVLVTARNTDSRSRRVSATSPNGASQWSEPAFLADLLEPGCMAGLVSHPGTPDAPKPVLLFSNPYTTERAHQDRMDVSIQLSEDSGRSWPVRRVLQPGPSAYSDLAVLPDGTILCFYESGAPATAEIGRAHV